MTALSTSGWQYRSIYRPSFYRHLNHLVINGFYARELDADDHAFLEQVRVCGIANGELPGYDAVSLEELDFWQFPYTIQPGVERKSGPVARRIPETPEQRKQRLLRTSAWHARRALRKAENAVAAAELERERLEWEKANKTRKWREMLSDEEWEAADPRRKKIRYGKVVDRHFVPQWKLDERGELNATDARKAKREQKRRQAREAQELDKFNREQAARITAEMLEQAAREAKLATLPVLPPDTATLKPAIYQLIKSTPETAWTRDTLYRMFHHYDQAFFDQCIKEMLRDGQLVPDKKARL